MIHRALSRLRRHRSLLRQHRDYARYIAKHKLHVGLVCLREGLPLRALTHDLSKLTPGEWGPYREYFYGEGSAERREANRDGKPDETGSRAFDLAWLMHLHRNRHHWQWWLLRKDDGSTVPLPMSERAMLEMLCDWYGAGAAITGEASWTRTKRWFEDNAHKIVLHPSTEARVYAFLNDRADRERDESPAS